VPQGEFDPLDELTAIWHEPELIGTSSVLKCVNLGANLTEFLRESRERRKHTCSPANKPITNRDLLVSPVP
jgi:hypothetical protein